MMDPKEESRIIRDLISKDESNLQEGNTYYLVSTRWYLTWQKYTGQPVDEDQSSTSSEHPGLIDNTDLVSFGHDPQLLRTVEEGCDFVLLPEEAWGRLHESYEGGPAIARKMITVGYKKQLVVEIFPLCLNLVDSRDKSRSVIQLSKKASLNELYEVVCQLKGLEKDKVRIFDYLNKRKQTMLASASNETLEDSNLLMDHHILLEYSSDDEFRPSKDNGFPQDMDECERETRKKRGMAGLQNLGNTCFMNSSLQCLAHTPPIMQYFLQDYSDEINKENPLGMRGELAVAFGQLLRMLWSSGKTSVPPRKFKQQLGRFAPQFSGYNQHDSQELLAFLLDGLHEDLNRVKRKPYIETNDSDNGRPDEEVADELWGYHKARNNSIIVDVCQGQYKSTLVCPSCSKVSITFDPFMYLSLPLPLTATRTMTVRVFHGDGTGLPVEITVTVLKHGSCEDLIQALATECCLSDNDEYLLLAEVYGHKVLKYFYKPSKEPLKNIKNGECIVAYRLPKSSKSFPKLEITHRFLRKLNYLLTPLVTFLENPSSTSDIDEAVGRVLAPFRKNCDTSPPLETSKFHLYLNNNFGSKFKPILRETPVNFEVRTVQVAMDWTEDEEELYDASCLNESPKVGLNDAKKAKQEDVSLFSCLDAFLKEEPLGADNMWYCPGCKEHRQATKKLDLWRLPDVLVFHLKRFSYSRWRKDKLETFVNFPVRDLDLSDYVGNKAGGGGDHVYELYAVSNHYGGLGGGHYSAYCKLIDDDNKWYHFDDSHVSEVDEDDVTTRAAYVLFYRRVGSKSNATTMDLEAV